MGGNVSKKTQEDTFMAWTIYGFGCSRFCNKAVFVPGAPRSTCCGTSCGANHSFATPGTHQADLLGELENDLPAAAAQAKPHLSWPSHVLFTQMDRTADKAAQVLNTGWCRTWNYECLHAAGLHCVASREVFGFGRSRVTHLVIRVVPHDKMTSDM